MDDKPLDFVKQSASSSTKSNSLPPENQKSEDEKQISLSYSTMDDEPLDLPKNSAHSPMTSQSHSAEKQNYLQEKRIKSDDGYSLHGKNILKLKEKIWKINEQAGIATANTKHKSWKITKQASVETANTKQKMWKITKQAGIETANTKHKNWKITIKAGIKTPNTKHNNNEKQTSFLEGGSPDNLLTLKRKRSSATYLEGERSKAETTSCTNVINKSRIPFNGNRISKATERSSFQKPSTSTDTILNKDYKPVQGSSADNKEFSFICKFCDKRFSKYRDHQNHVRSHAGKKPYKCVFCDKSFKYSSDLTTHRRIHTGEKPYT